MSVLINTKADALSKCIRKRKYSSSKIKLNTAEMSALVDISERLFRKRQYPFSNFWKAECGLSNLYIYVVRNKILKYFSSWADVTICDGSYMSNLIKSVGCLLYTSDAADE